MNIEHVKLKTKQKELTKQRKKMNEQGSFNFSVLFL